MVEVLWKHTNPVGAVGFTLGDYEAFAAGGVPAGPAPAGMLSDDHLVAGFALLRNLPPGYIVGFDGREWFIPSP
jgi:hypothetical protein